MSPETARQISLRRDLEREAAERVRGVLHAPAIRALEALLRGILFLVAGIADRRRVRVLVLDVSRSELEADLGGDLETSGVLRALVEPLPDACGGAPPALLVGAFEFGADARSLALLNRIAMVAHVVGAPWVSSAAPDVLGLPSFDGDADRAGPAPPDALWEALRSTPAARSVGLVAPPFLLRAPYGPDTDPCDRLPVDETGGGGAERYLWGNAAFVAAAAIAAEFDTRGWTLEGRSGAEFGGRPIDVRGDGRAGARPVRSVWSGARVEEARERGVMPLVGHRREARMRLPWIGSIASPPTPLAAWWDRA